MKLYNTLTRRMEEFAPLEGNHVRLYTCGPTVYNFAHIGNFRAYTFEDVLRRHLQFSGYRVTQVMNLTDVDDKTIRGAREAGLSLKAYTKRYADAFFEDLKTLNIEPAEHYPAATDHVPEMIALIERLLSNGHAYKSDDGSVYFNIRKFPDYGKLAHLDMAGMKAGARVARDEYDKENVSDFALWKAWDEADGDVVWDAPWGRGRPGWHIECSAMSTKYLGESFDIHTGGIDNMFPHHENEIAQSEAASGKPFVRTWLHCGYLVVDGQKMAKSLGNFYTLRELIQKGYEGREVRYLLISAHYRQPLNFTFDALNAAKAALRRLDDFQARLDERVQLGPAPAAPAGRAPEWVERGMQRFKAALDDDLNMSGALGALFDMVHDGNKALDTGEADAAAAASAGDALRQMDRVLGVRRAEAAGPDDAVQQLIEQRQAARQAKNWAESDRVRRRLAELGWEVRDTPEGQKVKKL